MHQSSRTKWFLAGVIALWLSVTAAMFGQGITTAALSGFINDKQGHPLAGATVTAVHVPTNTSFTARTSSAGRFNFTGLPVGGPYTVTAQADGYSISPLTGVQTGLGETTEVMLVAISGAEEVVQLEKFEVTGELTDLDSSSAGAGSVLSNRRIQAQPTVARSFTDLMKTNPFVGLRAGSQASALGMNNRYNSITLDGAKINDSFGLNSNGLFSIANPFSLEAVEQFSVSLTPYDVRQSGFAGAAMNAVSKSGTNEFHGSVYNYITKSDWQGADLSGTNKNTRPFLNQNTYGATLGGPILKDRLFFFLNYEKFTSDSTGISPAFTPDSDAVAQIQQKIASLPGSPNLLGLGGSSINRLEDEKKLVKIDWNITKDHRLSVRYSTTEGQQPNTGSLASTSFSQPVTPTGQPFTNGGTVTGFVSNIYTLDIKEKVWAAQLFSDWTPDLKTELRYSNTKQDSVRATPVKFPEIRIFNLSGTTGSGTQINNGALRAGTEISSMGNELHIKTETMGGAASYTWNQFTFTAGADYEKSDYLNLFRQGSYGYFNYLNLADFLADQPNGFGRSVVQTGFPTADISQFGQTGVYGQVKWEPTSRLTLTAGLRVDYLESPIAPAENTAFKSAFGVTNAGTIDGSTVPAPRFSFNYAVDKDRNTQLRGGWGVFLGRNPWVWISNSYGNTGVGRFNVTSGAATSAAYTGPTLTQYLNGTFSNDPAYKFDPANPIGTIGTSGTASSINLITPGMKPPMIERGNIAIDQKLPFLDSVLTLEYIDTKQISALFVDNMNLKRMNIGADGRQRWSGSASSAPVVSGFANVIRTRNVHEGASQYFSIGLDRPFKDGWAYTLSYTHGHATEAQTLNSSTANSQWQFNPVFNQNTVEVSRSDYEIKDRVQASITRELRFVKDAPTTFSLYYEGRTGLPFSYVYSNDMNGDGFTGNDLLAVPSGANDSRFDFSGMTAAQQTAYFDFLQSSGLSRFAGGHAPRNAFLTPWQNRLDLRIVQEIPTFKSVKVEVFADFLNFGSWLAPKFFNYIDLLNTSSTNGGQTRVLGSATYTQLTANGYLIKPTVNLNADGSINFPTTSQFAYNNAESRWKVQMGARIRF